MNNIHGRSKQNFTTASTSLRSTSRHNCFVNLICLSHSYNILHATHKPHSSPASTRFVSLYHKPSCMSVFLYCMSVFLYCSSSSSISSLITEHHHSFIYLPRRHVTVISRSIAFNHVTSYHRIILPLILLLL